MTEHSSHAHAHTGDSCSCLAGSAAQAFAQTLDEMEWERSLHAAAQAGSLPRLGKLLQTPSARAGIDQRDSSGFTALHYAARQGHAAVCQRLLDLGADVDAQTPELQTTPLHRAIVGGHADVAAMLLRRGARMDLPDADGRTPLSLAEQAGDARILALLSQRR